MNHVNDNNLYVDASTAPTNPGPTEYRGLLNGKIIFSKSIGHTSNNVGEFLALVHAIALYNHQPELVNCIYSDSLIAIKWVLSKRAKSKIPHGQEIVKVVSRAEKFLNENKLNVKVTFYNKKIIGIENPADYGRKGSKWQKKKAAVVKKEPTIKKETSGKIIHIHVDDKCVRAFLQHNNLYKRWFKFVMEWEKIHNKKTTISV